MMPTRATTPTGLVPDFERAVLGVDARAARPTGFETLMLNVGLRCESACAHCHHSCSPERTEVMSRTVMLDALALAEKVRPALIDVTGGEPELFEHLRELVELATGAGHAVRVRTNLVALARPGARDLPEFFARHGVALLGSLPGTSAAAIEAQRGSAWWETALSVLRHLAALGYGSGDARGARRRLVLDLAYNPPMGALPRPQCEIEAEFRSALDPMGVRFDSFLAIANVPVGRFAQRLASTGQLADHRRGLAEAFNPDAVDRLACRRGLEIAWDGTLWDCDFNLAAGARPAGGPAHVRDLLCARDVHEALGQREIGFGAHCFACTAGAGSS